MILNLETEKAVDSSKRLGIVSGYPQLRTALGVLGLIGDLGFQSLDGLYAWRHRGMDEHRNGKIALGELYCDHRQMLADSVLASRIGGLVALYLDSAAVSKEMEMVGCLLVAKTHTLIATGIYALKMVFRVWRSLLSNCVQTPGAKSIQEKKVKKLHGTQNDGRAVLIRLTRQGRETATELARARQEKFARILAAIPARRMLPQGRVETRKPYPAHAGRQPEAPAPENGFIIFTNVSLNPTVNPPLMAKRFRKNDRGKASPGAPEYRSGRTI
jgi:hypothetical protein